MSNNMPRQSREKSGTGIYQMIIRTVPLIVMTKPFMLRFQIFGSHIFNKQVQYQKKQLLFLIHPK